MIKLPSVQKNAVSDGRTRQVSGTEISGGPVQASTDALGIVGRRRNPEIGAAHGK